MPSESTGTLSSGQRPAQGARCGNHPAVPAVDLCQRCGTFLCGDCVELIDETVYCPHCFQRLGAGDSPSVASRLSLVLGFVGLLWGFLPGIVGLGIAAWELRQIRAGRSSARGLRYARYARILGLINFGLFCLAFLYLAAQLRSKA